MDEHFGSKAKVPLGRVQMQITMVENLKLVLLCDPRNLGLLGALRAKTFANWHFLH
jgi:hypothetical protein